ncbi:MAG TPA: twin-arginine translocation pathway signal protein [Ramlibacter sp.]|uniref:twin-arginine translocation pathway signal protein n=1 Tax=Ramlibacter sp. TaxID=1917967 RepID=UPI002CB0BE1B|nr:twin-arginine translocation pathway signal protein [Ramlibacter sp.]HVZ46174.1 twin-arginine translocation pathway signal protein [Ramlibacter sp.]
MDRRTFIRMTGGAAALAAGADTTACSADLPAEAVAAWRGPPADEPDIRRWALGYAILAPHSHNLQSWRADLRTPGELVLTCDPERLLPQTDPYSRQIMMSHGTFLELLDIAAGARGWRTEIALFPDGEFDPRRIDGRPVARVRFEHDAAQKRDPLFEQIVRRHTNREAYEPRVPEPAALRAIEQAVAGSAMRVGFTTSAQPDLVEHHRAIALDAWRIELQTPRTILESLRVMRIGPKEIAEHRDGLSANGWPLRALTALGMFDRSKAPGPRDYAVTSQVDDFRGKLAATPAFFWMVSEGNDRRTQVNAGRA